MITIAHVITGLERGGAEGALSRLVVGMDRAAFSSFVISLRDMGAWGPKLVDAGIEVRALNARTLIDMFAALSRLRRILRARQPDIVQSWLYHADFMATLARPSSASLAWNLRNSDLSESRRWRMLVAVLASMSRRPDVVIANAVSGLQAHIDSGYRPRRTVMISNGVDTKEFCAAPQRRARARARLKLPDGSFLIGMPARFNPAKDHATFFAAASRIATDADVHFVLAGVGVKSGDSAIARMITSAGLGARVHLLGEVDDMPELYNALDLVTLTSVRGEGFPNVLAEAMSCGVPVVATDGGDAQDIVGECGVIVAPRDPAALAAAWFVEIQRSAAERARRGDASRYRIETKFSLDASIQRYEALYRELASQRQR